MCMCKSIRWGLRKLIRVEEESEVGCRRMEAGMLGEKVRERPKQKKKQKPTVGVKKHRSQTGARWEEQAQ